MKTGGKSEENITDLTDAMRVASISTFMAARGG